MMYKKEVLYKHVIFGTILRKGSVTNYLYKTNLHLIDSQ